VKAPRSEVCPKSLVRSNPDVNALASVLLMLVFLVAGTIQEVLRNLWIVPPALC